MRLSSDSEWRAPIPLSDMGAWLPLVAVAVEDKRFYSHIGVDPLALLRAACQNAARLRVVSGASTITSQTIRMAVSERERMGGRGLSVKLREFIQAVKLERVMSKDEILETWLNLAPFGGNIRGVQAASLIYFGKPTRLLSPGEACLLIGMLKGPSLYRPDRRPEAARRRRDFIINFLEKRGVFSKEEARKALSEPLPSQWKRPPSRAWHFAEQVLARGVSERDDTYRTTLDLEAQTKLEAVLRRTIAAFPDFVTAAAGVADNETGGIIAWVGNARFGSGAANAWVDCALAPRSPGSALKPFAYVHAFDKGILTPGSLLADTPLAFSGRAPRNFDLTYRGAVSARVALSDSLNAPAVRVLRMGGADGVLRLMRAFGLSGLNERASHYGDSLILGGCEVTVLQMLEAYSSLANGGLHRTISFLENSPRPAGDRLASEAAVWMATDILDNKSRLSTFARESERNYVWRAALKTGTSYGLRDAWAAAWTPRFTVVVWVGAPSGESWPGLVGAGAAAPVALSVLRVLSAGESVNKNARSAWYERQEGLVLREVCALSGRPPTPACLSRRLDWSIEGVTRTTPCDIHVLRNGQSALLWPTSLAAAETPATDIRRSNLNIVSPISGATYYMAPLAREQKIPLRSEGARGASGKVWWYLDGRFIGLSAANDTFFYAFPDGRHKLSVSDGTGGGASTSFNVASPGKKRSAPELSLW
ncbi:penicillin-binding protein 1C [Synergistales bacterium]|nr:penicillin-binding protein 1C [Synergistales bacterium]